MAVSWLLLIIIGLLIAQKFATGGASTVIELVNALASESPFFVVGFWLAATAALFSTADTQVYSFLLVAAFDPKKGDVQTNSSIAKAPLLAALLIAFVFSAVYYLVAEWSLPFEQLVFFIFPLFLCLVPGLTQILKGSEIAALPMIVALVLYLACGLGMVLLPKFAFFFSLGAPLMPAVVAAGLSLTPSKRMA